MSVLLIVVLAGVGVLIGFASTSRGDEFWTVAMPGIVTGGGTLVLAISTVWLAVSSRLRDDVEKLVADHRLIVERHRQYEEDAVTEARKVVCWLGSNLSNTAVVVHVVNASTQPIVRIWVKQVEVAGPVRDNAANIGLGLPEGGYNLADIAGPVPVLLQASETLFESRARVSTEPGTPSHFAMDDELVALVGLYKPRIRWTDSGGREWERYGDDEPVQRIR